MLKLLSSLFIKNRKQYRDEGVRVAYGVLCSAMGIFLNLLLFGGKYFAGVLTASVAVTADAFNNLSDAGSSVISLLGFALAGMKADRGHPFGLGRIEYVAGLAVAAFILVMGVDLLRSSVGRILHPGAVQAGWLPLAILGVSIAVKLYMFAYNRATSKKIGSAAMNAAARDSLGDAFATGAVFLSTLLSGYAGLRVDGWFGLLVSLFILWSGYGAARDTLSPLLGQAPSREYVREIETLVTAHPEIVGVHDLIVHDYGPGRRMISLHAEVPETGDLLALHDAIDAAERELSSKLGCDAVIHMDPIATEDEAVLAMREATAEIAREIDGRLTIHDFRCVRGPTHTNLIFDAVVPPRFSLTDAELIRALAEKVRAVWPECYVVVTVDRSYMGP